LVKSLVRCFSCISSRGGAVGEITHQRLGHQFQGDAFAKGDRQNRDADKQVTPRIDRRDNLIRPWCGWPSRPSLPRDDGDLSEQRP
jgi:hypothetical protein